METPNETQSPSRTRMSTEKWIEKLKAPHQKGTDYEVTDRYDQCVEAQKFFKEQLANAKETLAKANDALELCKALKSQLLIEASKEAK